MEGKSSKVDLSAGDNELTMRTSAPAPSAKDTKSEKKSSTKPSSKKDEEMLITIDLTDPADLMRKMEMIDFTEEETNELMKQAIEVNKMLKKELQKHEFESLRQNFSRAVTISAATGERTSGLMVLPPVETDGKTKANLASLSFKNQSKSTPPSAAGPSRSSISRKSSDGGGKKASAKPKKSAAPKAEWSDRWN